MCMTALDVLDDVSHKSRTVCDLVARNAAGLVRVDDPSNNSLQPVSYYLDNDLVVHVQKRDANLLGHISPFRLYTIVIMSSFNDYSLLPSTTIS